MDGGEPFRTPARRAARRRQLPSESGDMQSSSDIILLVTSEGKEWGEYISYRLNACPQVSHTTLNLILNDSPREPPAELKATFQHSAVVLLLATTDLLTYMQKRAGRLAPILTELPSTCSVVVFLLLDRTGLDEVTQKCGYATSEWKYKDVRGTDEEVQERLAEVVDQVEQNRLWQSGRAAPSLPRAPAKPLSVEFFPSTIYERNTRVAMVFREEVRGEVTLKLEQTDCMLTTVRETPTVFTFTAPRKPPGKYSVRLFVEGRRQRGRPELTFPGLEVPSLTCPRYLAQALRLSGEQDLDVHLKDLFNRSLPADQGLQTLFRHLPELSSAEHQKNADTKYPTLLHFAAAFGLSEFSAALLDCPGSCRAFYIRNCDGLDPAELAAENGHDELEDYILDLMEIQVAAQDDGHGYMTMTPALPDPNPLPPESLYANPLHAYPADGVPREPSLPRSLPRPALPPRPEALPSPSSLPSSSLPSSAPSSYLLYWTMGMTRAEAEGEDLSSSSSPSLPAPAGPGPEPVPPPRNSRRTRSFQLPENPAQPTDKASTLPVGAKLDPSAFMGTEDGEPSDQDALPAGALGSRSQGELIEVQELVKAQEISQRQAQMLFHSWQQRFSRDTSLSFKDRQNGLLKIKSEFKHQQQQQEKTNHGATERRSLLSRFLFGGRQRKPPSIKMNISEPMLSPTGKKPPKVYTRPSSDSQLLPAKAEDRDSAISVASSQSRSSLPSGSLQSRLSNSSFLSADSETDIGDHDDVFRQDVPYRYDRKAPNRLSLGGQFLRQAVEEGEKSGRKPLPPLPKVNLPSLPSPQSGQLDICEQTSL